MDTIAEMSDDDHVLQAFIPDDNIGYTQAAIEMSGQMLKYDRSAKPINIKTLKETMWKSIDKENSDSGSDDRSFLGVIDDIQKKVRPSELENLSIHSCFIALLHLANENNLLLK
jgi:hypothetical protein